MPGNRPVIIYISAASDLMVERETLARMIARLPVTLAWQIVQSPLEGEMLDLDALQGADLHLLLMGMDIRAPIGLEWRMAVYAGRQTIAFLKTNVARTMAGQSFVRETGVGWKPFSGPADLNRQAQQALIDHLLTYDSHYALTPVEVEQLQTLKAEEASPTQTDPAGLEAGRSAVILSRERYEPSEGILIGDADEETEPGV
jgi:hypothetical protein